MCHLIIPTAVVYPVPSLIFTSGHHNVSSAVFDAVVDMPVSYCGLICSAVIISRRLILYSRSSCISWIVRVTPECVRSRVQKFPA